MGYHTTEIVAMGRSSSIVLLNKVCEPVPLRWSGTYAVTNAAGTSQLVLVVQVLWSISLGLTKGSILILYTKVFQVNSFILISKITAILVFLWLVDCIPRYAIARKSASFPSTQWLNTGNQGACAYRRAFRHMSTVGV